MYYNQEIATQELRAEYSGFPWENDGELLEKWQKGETGFDIVDAGMREIWQTGTMHGRTRMVVASFLIKDLLTDWKTGEQWFWDCLFDADPAVNPFSWQWVFGSGFDGAPYFRIFNPDLQRQRFDEKGKYCTKWLGNFYNIDRIVDHDFKKQVTMDKYKLLLNKL
jgi:deoxyribodipyrimidine photo-lyase